MDLAALIAVILEFVTGKLDRNSTGNWTFTLEPGKGATYNNGKATLYAHSEFKGGVMDGRELRRWVTDFDSYDAAKAAMAEVAKAVPKFAKRYEDLCESGGDTYIPIEQLTAHLPDDEG